MAAPSKADGRRGQGSLTANLVLNVDFELKWNGSVRLFVRKQKGDGCVCWCVSVCTEVAYLKSCDNLKSCDKAGLATAEYGAVSTGQVILQQKNVCIHTIVCIKYPHYRCSGDAVA